MPNSAPSRWWPNWSSVALALLFQPLAAVLMLAGGAMAVAAAVGPPMRALAVLAMPDRPAQWHGTTPAQPTQHFELVDRYGVALEVFGQEYLQDLGECQLRRLAGGTTHLSIRSDLRSSNPSGLWI